MGKILQFKRPEAPDLAEFVESLKEAIDPEDLRRELDELIRLDKEKENDPKN